MSLWQCLVQSTTIISSIALKISINNGVYCTSVLLWKRLRWILVLEMPVNWKWISLRIQRRLLRIFAKLTDIVATERCRGRSLYKRLRGCSLHEKCVETLSEDIDAELQASVIVCRNINWQKYRTVIEGRVNIPYPQIRSWQVRATDEHHLVHESPEFAWIKFKRRQELYLESNCLLNPRSIWSFSFGVITSAPSSAPHNAMALFLSVWKELSAQRRRHHHCCLEQHHSDHDSNKRKHVANFRPRTALL